LSPGVRKEGPHYREKYFHFCLFQKKKIFSRTSGSISIKLGTNHPWLKVILNCSNKGPGPPQRGIIIKMPKFGEVIEIDSP
jgi:hypothetical protein